MASRRTRIKGIANIPQRRKTTTTSEEYPQATPEITQTEDEKPNLTLETPHGNEKLQLETTEATIPQSLPTKEVSAALSESTVEENVVHQPPSEKVSEKLDSNLDKPSEPELKPFIPVRRKFIKPTVSLNAIIRKSKDSEEVKPVPINHQPKNSKIVVLNEIIAYPDQTEHVVIHNFKQDVDSSVSVDRTEREEINSGKKTQPNTDTSIKSLDHPQRGDKKLQIGDEEPQINTIERDSKRLIPSPQVQISEPEYPIPPPSPSKVNRSRIKAVPRLGQRNTSFSASESEDESRRNYRHRNDSVCSTASGFQDSNSAAECLSPQKPKEFNSVIQRKCRRTEQSRKLAEARRDFMIKFGNKKPDRQKLTMMDLIFYNPTTNLMSHDTKTKKEVADAEGGNNDVAKSEEKVDDPAVKSGSDEENEMPAPQIKIGPQGEIVVDEQSLVIENKAVKKNLEELEKSKVVNGDFDTGYGLYKRTKRSKDWSKHETLKFYKALNTIGTDFALMCELFPRRSRRELKMKFKKEERINRTLIDRAIMQPCGFDFNDFKHEVDMEEKELLEVEKQKEREQLMRKEAKKRKATHVKNNPPQKMPRIVEKPKKKKTFDIMNVLDDDSDADKSDMEGSVFDEDEDQGKLMQTIQKPTRSGRVPKMLDRYRPSNTEPKGIPPEPGSLIVLAGTGSNGEPVYQVCMITGDNTRQQIGENMDSLSKALECKNNSSYIKSLFTLSTTSIPKQEEPIEMEENNVTIPADADESAKSIAENETVSH